MKILWICRSDFREIISWIDGEGFLCKLSVSLWASKYISRDRSFVIKQINSRYFSLMSEKRRIVERIVESLWGNFFGELRKLWPFLCNIIGKIISRNDKNFMNFKKDIDDQRDHFLELKKFYLWQKYSVENYEISHENLRPKCPAF